MSTALDWWEGEFGPEYKVTLHTRAIMDERILNDRGGVKRCNSWYGIHRKFKPPFVANRTKGLACPGCPKIVNEELFDKGFEQTAGILMRYEHKWLNPWAVVVSLTKPFLL